MTDDFSVSRANTPWGDTMCHHREIAEWEAIRDRLDEAEEPIEEPAELDEEPSESDDGRDRPDVPTPPADD